MKSQRTHTHTHTLQVTHTHSHLEARGATTRSFSTVLCRYACVSVYVYRWIGCIDVCVRTRCRRCKQIKISPNTVRDGVWAPRAA